MPQPVGLGIAILHRLPLELPSPPRQPPRLSRLPPMTSTPGSFGTLANSGPVALSFAASSFAGFLGGPASGGAADSSGLSKFKAMPPPSLPLSHPPASPSSFLNALSGFLDSPILLTPSVSMHGLVSRA